MMSEATVMLGSPTQSLSLAADFNNRYPGEQVTFFLQFTAPEQDSTVLQFSIPRVLKVESYTLPDGIPSSLPIVTEMDQDLVVQIPLETHFKAGQQYEVIMQVRIDNLYFDHHIQAEARLLDADRQVLSMESIRVTVWGRGKYLEFLPELYGSDDFTSRFLMLFESFWKPINRQIDQIESYFDPDLTPQEFIPWLSSWIGLPVDEHLPVERMRRLLNRAMYMFQRRGTLEALRTTLEIYTEGEVQIQERRAKNFVLGSDSPLGASIALGRDNRPNSVSVKIRLPHSELARWQFTEEMYQLKMKEIVRGLVPAHAVFDVSCEFYTEQDQRS